MLANLFFIFPNQPTNICEVLEYETNSAGIFENIYAVYVLQILRIQVQIRSIRTFRPTAKVNRSCPCTKNPNKCLSYQVNGRKTMIRDFAACSLFYLFINNTFIL